MTALEHITLTTGAARMSRRSEVQTAAVRALARAIAAGQPLGWGWTAIVRPSPAGTHRWTLASDGLPIADCWLCLWSSASAALWEEATAEGVLDELVSLHPPRGVPWLAAALLPGALHAPREAIMEAGDLERCVAWALIEGGA